MAASAAQEHVRRRLRWAAYLTAAVGVIFAVLFIATYVATVGANGRLADDADAIPEPDARAHQC